MKHVALMFAVLASPAFADLISPDVANCRGLSAGAPCTTAEGGAGKCVETTVTRLDYSGGVPPTPRQVKQLSCQGTAQASSKVSPAWFGVGLAFIALVFALRSRRTPQLA